MVQWYLGTMGFSYKDWEGVFYPASLNARDYLAHYGRVFNAVELDSTFYGSPKTETVERWATLVPPDFRFTAKTPRAITHDAPLRDGIGLMRSFVETMRLLGDRLGVILIQLAPDFAFDEIHTLSLFLRELPTDVRFAVEFRHASWHATATGELLQRYSVAWASAEYIHMPRRIYVTTDLVYMRWIGRHGRYQSHSHERVDMSERLEEWRDQIEARSAGVSAVYGFFNNDYAGFAPGTCNRFKELAGLPTNPLQPPQQGRLFEE
jgi:uncharacterized protein YecE (DUF72 family)